MSPRKSLLSATMLLLKSCRRDVARNVSTIGAFAFFPALRLQTKHRRMMRLQHLSVTQVHMHTAGQTRIEAAHGAHDVDSLELVRAVFLEDRRVLHGVLVWSRRAVNVAWIRIPGRRRIRMVIGYLAFLDDYMVREHTANRFVESASDGLFGNLEVGPRLGAAGMKFGKSLLHEVQRTAGGIYLEVGSCTVAFNRIAPLGNLPFEFDL